ncbi:hypothetical protein AHAS_Ahas07G0062500 [Arachis hypogaea]
MPYSTAEIVQIVHLNILDSQHTMLWKEVTTLMYFIVVKWHQIDRVLPQLKVPNVLDRLRVEHGQGIVNEGGSKRRLLAWRDGLALVDVLDELGVEVEVVTERVVVLVMETWWG